MGETGGPFDAPREAQRLFAEIVGWQSTPQNRDDLTVVFAKTNARFMLAVLGLLLDSRERTEFADERTRGFHVPDARAPRPSLHRMVSAANETLTALAERRGAVVSGQRSLIVQVLVTPGDGVHLFGPGTHGIVASEWGQMFEALAVLADAGMVRTP